jgi:hypothetical protein
VKISAFAPIMHDPTADSAANDQLGCAVLTSKTVYVPGMCYETICAQTLIARSTSVYWRRHSTFDSSHGSWLPGCALRLSKKKRLHMGF